MFSTPLNAGGGASSESVVCVTENSIFNHGHYRHEIAVLTTLPLQQYVECDQGSAHVSTFTYLVNLLLSSTAM